VVIGRQLKRRYVHRSLRSAISVSKMLNNPTIVQKYGGACLETPAKIHAVASSLADLRSRGYRVVAVVSAMGKATDELVRMAYQVSPHPNRRELDMLLTTGERISMSLMSMALSDLGVPAISRR
jgi:aspartate kinase